jgi:hypothetical protein
MTEEARREWLAVAWATLGHLPGDLLASGARKARETCDHHAKIVPTIIEETKQWMSYRRDAAREDHYRDAPALPKPDYIAAEEARKILEELGLKSSNQSA